MLAGRNGDIHSEKIPEETEFLCREIITAFPFSVSFQRYHPKENHQYTQES
jgi:hypothetical protein